MQTGGDRPGGAPTRGIRGAAAREPIVRLQSRFVGLNAGAAFC